MTTAGEWDVLEAQDRAAAAELGVGGRSRFADGADREVLRLIDAGMEESALIETSWAAVDLGPYKRGDVVIEPPVFLKDPNGHALIYPGRPHVFYGESESLKSWAALKVCQEVVAAGLSALYVDFEGSEPSFVERCRLVGVPEAAIGGALQYVRPSEPLTGQGMRGLFARSEWVSALARVTGLVVLDGVSECYALHNWSINAAEDAARFQQTFSVEGPATIAIDHTAKEAGRGVIGSQHKRAGLDGAEYEFKSVVRGGRGGESTASVKVTKDRHGWVREWAPSTGAVGTIRVAPEGVSLISPAMSLLVDPRDDRRDRVVEFVTGNPGTSAAALKRELQMGDDESRNALHEAESLGLLCREGTSTRPHWYSSPPAE